MITPEEARALSAASRPRVKAEAEAAHEHASEEQAALLERFKWEVDRMAERCSDAVRRAARDRSVDHVCYELPFNTPAHQSELVCLLRRKGFFVEIHHEVVSTGVDTWSDYCKVGIYW